MKKTGARRASGYEAGYESGLGSGVLTAPEESYASAGTLGDAEGRGARKGPAPAGALHRGFGRAYDEPGAGGYSQDEPEYVPQRGKLLRFRSLQRSVGGRIVLGVAALAVIAAGAVAFAEARSFLMHDARFVLASSDDVQITGAEHLTREQIVSVFGSDLERNIFRVSLAERQADLERLPWVAHATVMRLLPNVLRVQVTERTPVAFVRQGSHIGLVDATGVLLDMPADEKMEAKYSFPVVSGIVASDPLSTRAARMKIFERFTAELDGSGEKISQGLSEVDLSNPEDVKALIPDRSMDILVHFGDSDFLNRYQRFEEHLPEWRTTYPKLSSVDMRYERQVVLEMQPGSGGTGSSAAVSANSTATASPTKAAAVHPATAKLATKLTVAAKHPALKAVKAKQAGKTQTAGKNQIAYTAKKPVPVKQNSQKKPAAHGEKVVQTSGSGPQYHASQVAHP